MREKFQQELGGAGLADVGSTNALTNGFCRVGLGYLCWKASDEYVVLVFFFYVLTIQK